MKSAVRTALLAALAISAAAIAQAPAPKPQVTTVPGMPPVPDASNLYSETVAGKIRPELANDLPRVYVPHIQSNDVYVIDPATFTVVGKLKAGLNPQHVVPSWDLRTLWVANNAENTNKGSLMPIDPATGKIGNPEGLDAEHVGAEGHRDRRVDAGEQIVEVLGAGDVGALARIRREVHAVVDGEADVVELDLVDAEALHLVGEAHDHVEVALVPRVEPRATRAPADPGSALVARSVVLDRALRLAQRELSIAEAHDSADHVDVGVVQGLHQRPGILDVPRLRARQLGDGRVVEHAAHAVLEVDHRRVHARAAQHAEDALDAVQSDVGARDVEPRRALHALGEVIVSCGLRERRGRPHRREGDDRQTERRCEEPPAHEGMLARGARATQQKRWRGDTRPCARSRTLLPRGSVRVGVRRGAHGSGRARSGPPAAHPTRTPPPDS